MKLGILKEKLKQKLMGISISDVVGKRETDILQLSLQCISPFVILGSIFASSRLFIDTLFS